MAKQTSKAKTAAAVLPKVSYEAATVRINVTDPGFNRDPGRNLTRPEGGRDTTTLAAQIEAQGQLQPVIVTRNGEGYDLQAGFGRTAAIAALHAAGKHDGYVEARVQVESDALSVALANVCENEDGKQEITWLGRLAGFEALKAQGLTVEQIAATVGRAKDIVRDTLRLSSAHPVCILALQADAKGEPVTGEVDGKEVTQAPVAWGTVRHVVKHAKSKQPELLRRVEGLSCEKARQFLANLDKPVEAPVEEPTGEGEGGGEGEGETPETGDELAAFQQQVADVLTPAFLALLSRVGALQAALNEGDIDAAVAQSIKLRETIEKGQARLAKVCGDDKVAGAQQAWLEKQAEKKAAKAR
jgi:hypothetical protein